MLVCASSSPTVPSVQAPVRHHHEVSVRATRIMTSPWKTPCISARRHPPPPGRGGTSATRRTTALDRLFPCITVWKSCRRMSSVSMDAIHARVAP